MTATTRTRIDWLDRLRGLAIALMLLDHVLAVTGIHGPLRLTVTRLALPFFMMCAGSLWRPLTARNGARLGAAALAELALCEYLRFSMPGILATFLGLMLALRARPSLANRPGLLVLAGLLQAAYLPLDGSWTGYQPGWVLAWWALGRLAIEELRPIGSAAPAWLAVAGRRPLTWYVGHLAVLAALAALL